MYISLKYVLSIGHEVFLNIYLTLINLYSQAQDTRNKLKYLRLVRDRTHLVFPPNWLPHADYDKALADTIQV